MLTGFNTSASGITAPTFELESVNIDGLGRLKSASETLTKPDNSTIAHSLTFSYDGLSQLVDANISNINGRYWTAGYNYQYNGDMYQKTVNSEQPTVYTYNGNEMNSVGPNSLSYDLNGNFTSDEMRFTRYEYNWDNKLRSATVDNNSISVKYDPAGNRVAKNSTVNGNRKYIVDVVGDLPVILLELETTDYAVKKMYIYANSQILAEHDGNSLADEYYYLHDRLGSVRQVINSSGAVVKMFTYNPFGEKLEEQGTFYTPWQFTGQFFDSETGQYHLRARQYSPYLSRFTGRDLIIGEFERPLSLHKYLYCFNDPINFVDLNGRWREGIHETLIDRAFSGISQEFRQQMYLGSAYADRAEFQDPEHAFMHGMRMRTARGVQSEEEARNQMWGYFSENYFQYRNYMERGQKLLAYNYLGRAMHPIMDQTCPVHDWQPWGGTKSEWTYHIANEPWSIRDEQRDETVELMQDAMRQYDIFYEVSKLLQISGLIGF